MSRKATLGALIGVGLLVGPALSQQPGDVVYRNFPPERVEQVLKSMNIVYTRTAGKQEGWVFFNFERDGIKMGLNYFKGLDLGTQALFTDNATREEVNGWNIRAKFSRAVLVKVGDRDATSLEQQLDCNSGTTDNIVKQFLLRFDNEIKDYMKYRKK